MADNISIQNRIAEMFSGNNIKPWHGLGTVIEGRATAKEVLEYAHLDWEVEKHPIFMKNPAYTPENGLPKGLKVPNQFAIKRNDVNAESGILGVVGDKYQPLQNTQQFGFFDEVVDRNEAVYESAGALGKGEKVWILAKMPETVVINGNDPIENYILLVNSHDGSLSFTAKVTPVRVVCQNTLSMALSGEGDYIKIKHTASIEDRVKEASRIMGLAKKQITVKQEAFNYLAGIQFDTTMLNYFLSMVVPSSAKVKTRATNLRDEIELLFAKTGKGVDLAGKTAWGAVNAVAEFVDHHKKYNEETDKLNAVWFGSGARMTRTAFDVALGIEKVSESEMLEVIKANA